MGFINSLVNKVKRRREISRRKSDLEGKLNRDYNSIQGTARGHNAYLIKYMASNDDVYASVGTKTPEQIFDEVKSWYSSIPHTVRRDKDLFTQYTEDGNGFNGITLRHLYRILLIKQNLQRQEFIDHVGQLIEADLADPYSEHGGLVLFDQNGNLILHPFESEMAKEKSEKNNGSYKLPEEADDVCKVLDYHFHATTHDDTRYSGPSGGMIFLGGDMASCKSETIWQGESHNLVFTKLAGDRFNVDYYGGEEMPRPEITRTWVLDLGNYEYKKRKNDTR